MVLDMIRAQRDLIVLVLGASSVAAAVHVDWHLGRPLDMSPSFGWSLHWLLGVAAGLALGWSFLRWRDEWGVDLVIVLGLGLILGQVVEPALEAWMSGQTFAAVNPPVRWELFGTFTLALVGSVALVCAGGRRLAAGLTAEAE